MAANTDAQEPVALGEEAPNGPLKAVRGVTLPLPELRGITRPLPQVRDPDLIDDEEMGAAVIPSISLPRLPSVSRAGLLTSGKYAVVPVRTGVTGAALPAQKAAAGEVLPVQARNSTTQPVALLLIPGRVPKVTPDLASKPHYLLYKRLVMVVVALLLLGVAGVSLSGLSFGAGGAGLAGSQESNAAAVAQMNDYTNAYLPSSGALTSLGLGGGAHFPGAVPPPPAVNLKPTPPPAAPVAPAGAPTGPYSSWTPPPGYASFGVQDFAGDPWAGVFGQCTWWAHSKRPDENLAGMGDAWNWANGASARGYLVTSTPAANSTMVFAPGVQGASGLGHVAHVEQVLTNGWVLISEMNFYWNGGGWGRVDYRYAYAGSGVWFIH
jgi:surface antigen